MTVHVMMRLSVQSATIRSAAKVSRLPSFSRESTMKNAEILFCMKEQDEKRDSNAVACAQRALSHFCSARRIRPTRPILSLSFPVGFELSCKLSGWSVVSQERTVARCSQLLTQRDSVRARSVYIYG